MVVKQSTKHKSLKVYKTRNTLEYNVKALISSRSEHVEQSFGIRLKFINIMFSSDLIRWSCNSALRSFVKLRQVVLSLVVSEEVNT